MHLFVTMTIEYYNSTETFLYYCHRLKLRFDDLTESIPVFCVITLMSFTYNIGIGMTAEFVAYPLFKLLTGKVRDVKAGLWVLTGLSLLFYVFYSY